jgi:hypothetical protein
MATIQGVLAYAKIQTSDFKYGSTTEKEFTVDVIVDKATGKNWTKEFKKQPAKIIDREDFEKAYKIEPPFDGDELYVIKLKRAAQYRDGTPIPDAMRPRVFVDSGDGTLEDVTKNVLVANGSEGLVSYEVRENDFGKFASLKAVRVDKLIEYKQKGGGSDFSELGVVKSLADDFSDVPQRELSEAQVKAHSKANPAPELEDEDSDSQLPF